LIRLAAPAACHGAQRPRRSDQRHKRARTDSDRPTAPEGRPRADRAAQGAHRRASHELLI
jgi:hypothetical protein